MRIFVIIVNDVDGVINDVIHMIDDVEDCICNNVHKRDDTENEKNGSNVILYISDVFLPFTLNQ